MCAVTVCCKRKRERFAVSGFRNNGFTVLVFWSRMTPDTSTGPHTSWYSYAGTLLFRSPQLVQFRRSSACTSSSRSGAIHTYSTILCHSAAETNAVARIYSTTGPRLPRPITDTHKPSSRQEANPYSHTNTPTVRALFPTRLFRGSSLATPSPFWLDRAGGPQSCL